MPEANVFFLPIAAVCQREVVTCLPDDALVSAVDVMRKKNVSSIVVTADEAPVGIVTDRDLRNKVVSRGVDPNRLSVSEIMSSPLIVIGEDELLFEALYRMSRQGIHRLGVVDANGRLIGILTDSDILQLQTRSPHKMVRDIEEAESLADLRILRSRINELVVHLTGTGVKTPDLVRLIAQLNDQLLLRLIALLRRDQFADLPQEFAFIVLGSEGRHEQTLTTDQDNAIVYADHLSDDQVRRLEEFSQVLIDALIETGVPPCPGGIMAKNPPWRRSLQAWRQELDGWLGNISSENILKGSMFFDLRTLYGDPSLEKALKEHIFNNIRKNEVFLARAALNVQGFRPPFGWFGRIKVEKKGPHQGLVDVKKAGIFALTEGVKVLSLQAGILDGGTRDRINALVAAGVLDSRMAADIEASFNYLVFQRLRGQVASIRRGETPTNYISLEDLNRMERGRFRLALEEVKNFLEFLRLRFRVDLLR
ncbi:DUF294 nucleotidyltransferase-like domain-containing protein [Desulfuromonas sp. AOP6]|uniref:DUF294 nucleotidyltransferase-like domain-containing protein n=1 Tax=Desulfuromonas sp. AOP6 TaxID=1566351 RepID=UPI0012719743|nr:DUF294 nucleotidyltransferase-like domain-containing protein [Desulfuromonas sp. AOP6]BCA80250.1 hypothetical protein AOP6_2037 [Desulfuromonas sp. AOP6]